MLPDALKVELISELQKGIMGLPEAKIKLGHDGMGSMGPVFKFEVESDLVSRISACHPTIKASLAAVGFNVPS